MIHFRLKDTGRAGRAARLGSMMAITVLLGLALLPSRAAAQAGAGYQIATVGTTTVVPEYNAKAGYLLLFSRYVEWPAATFASANSPIIIGILGENPFGDVLARTVAGQIHEGRPIVVATPRTREEAMHCHIVFIPRENQRMQSMWLEELRGAPVLTVVESTEGLDKGAIVCFAAENGNRGTRLKFDVSLLAAEKAGIRISAPMLSAARRVLRAPAAGGGR